jgi:DNA-binding NarL/FixJ family response regulator
MEIGLDLALPAKPAKFRILLADDSQLIRRAVVDILARDSECFVVCGEASDGEEAVRKVTELLPDILLVDLSLPKIHGLKVAERALRAHPLMRIVLMSAQDEKILSAIAKSAGLSYAIPKSQLAYRLLPLLATSCRTGSPE